MFLAHSCTKHRPWLLSFRSEAMPIYKALAKYKQLAIVTELAPVQFVLCCASESSTERVHIPVLMQLWITWCLTAKKFRALATRRCVLSSKQSSKMASTVTQSVTSFASPIRLASTLVHTCGRMIKIYHLSPSLALWGGGLPYCQGSFCGIHLQDCKQRQDGVPRPQLLQAREMEKWVSKELDDKRI